jgi:hypothetical protein
VEYLLLNSTGDLGQTGHLAMVQFDAPLLRTILKTMDDLKRLVRNLPKSQATYDRLQSQHFNGTEVEWYVVERYPEGDGFEVENLWEIAVNTGYASGKDEHAELIRKLWKDRSLQHTGQMEITALRDEEPTVRWVFRDSAGSTRYYSTEIRRQDIEYALANPL